jgi:sterol desaturase/sphingolipid hydroxylase (fatty acid hydroxylase superfamily)
MNTYFDTFVNAFPGYFHYLVHEILHPSWTNWFYWLIGLSLLVYGLEIAFPWRQDQAIVRKDFWLDGFYLFFNFFLFSLIGYNAISMVAVQLFHDGLMSIGVDNLAIFKVGSWPRWAQLLTMFIIADFIQWNIHRLLHRYPRLWEFHKVHHSVEEMGFAAHFRFHWMETIVYKTLQYVPLALIGFGISDFMIIHIIAVLIGHLNHANIKLTYGPLKYILNNPVMHLWHHAHDLPNGKYGVNYGLSLSVWDYLFGTSYIPTDDGKTRLGFEGVEHFPRTFIEQSKHGF